MPTYHRGTFIIHVKNHVKNTFIYYARCFFDKRFEAVRFKRFEPSFMCFSGPSIRGNGVLLGMWECFSRFKTFD